MNRLKKSKILAIVPARGGSKGLPKKNIKSLVGKPLIYYTLNEAKKSQYLTKIVVSTEDNSISNISKKYGIQVIKRPLSLSKDNSKSIDVVKHVILFLEKNEKFIPDVIILLQPTSPLRLSSDIDKAIKKFLSNDCDTVVSMTETHFPPFGIYSLKNKNVKPILKNPKNIFRRQDSKNFYQINGAIYISTKNFIMKKNSMLGKKILPYIMPIERSIDIDSKIDFLMAKFFLRNKSKF